MSEVNIDKKDELKNGIYILVVLIIGQFILLSFCFNDNNLLSKVLTVVSSIFIGIELRALYTDFKNL